MLDIIYFYVINYDMKFTEKSSWRNGRNFYCGKSKALRKRNGLLMEQDKIQINIHKIY